MRARALLAAAAVAASLAGAGTNVVTTATDDCPFCDICIRDQQGTERVCAPLHWPPRIELPPQG